MSSAVALTPGKHGECDRFLSTLLVKVAKWVTNTILCSVWEVGFMVKEIRIFRCSCNHQLRYGVSSCSYCFRPTPIWNRWWLPLVLVAVIGAGIWLKQL